ncbi:MAG: hypothetical protein DRI61_12135 [Chloroflexi bacterium]|nr:MAG: hypothetical protein DRI61_12135 [Chloroflexota bacterium]
MGLKESARKLEEAFRVLKQQWDTTRGLWKDPVQRRFEREFWQVYEPTVYATIKQMERLAETIAQACREVK